MSGHDGTAHTGNRDAKQSFLCGNVAPDSDACRHSDFDAAALLDDVMQALPAPMIIADANERVLAVNDNFRFLFGYFTPLAPSTHLENVVPPNCLAAFRSVLGATQRDGAVQDVSLPPFTGSWHEMRFLLSGSLTRNPSPVPPSILILREVSAGIRLAKLEDKDEMQDYLFRAVIHDMRSPLAAVVNGLELLGDVQGGPKAPITAAGDTIGVQEILGVIERSAAKIGKLLDDTQGFMASRGGRRTVQLAAVSLAAITEDVIDVYRLQESPNEMRFSSEGDTLVRIDALRVARAIDNLLSNAVKYSPQGGVISVRAFNDANAGQVVLEIKDEGLGIPADCLDKIWEPFYRLERDRSSRIFGSGLGLSIVRFVVEEQGGSVLVASTTGAGSTFTLKFPSVQEQRTARSNGGAPPARELYND